MSTVLILRLFNGCIVLVICHRKFFRNKFDRVIEQYQSEIQTICSFLTQGENFVVTLFIEGQPIADAKGFKKQIKMKVAESTLEFLTRVCYTIRYELFLRIDFDIQTVDLNFV